MLLEDAAFVINTGDMVARADEQRWAHFFETERDLLSRVVLYPAMGNHELAGGRARGRRLFKEMFKTPRNGPDPGIVYSFVHGNAKIIFIDTNSDFIGTDQSSWAKGEMLRASADPDTRHIFLVAHHGPYSSGPHGPNRRLAESGLLDVSRRCGVDIIFSGHDHLYERGEVDGLRYVVSGGGGAPPYQVERAQPYSRVVDVSHHYVRVTVDGDEVEVVARRTDGSVIDGFGYVKSAEAAAGKNRFTVIHDRHPALDGRRLAGMIAAAAELSSAGAEVFSGSIAVRWLLVGAAVVVGLALLWLLLGRSSAEEL
jgi:predicted phosphodiesterase